MLALVLIPRSVHAADNVGEKPQPVVDDGAKARVGFGVVLGIGALTVITGGMVLGLHAGVAAICGDEGCTSNSSDWKRGQVRLLRIGLATSISGGVVSSVGAVGLFAFRAPKLAVGSLSLQPTATLKSLGIRGTF